MTILAPRSAHRAYRAAINAGRRNADVETTVEAGIVRRKGAVTAVCIEVHAGIMRRRPTLYSPFSDLISESTRTRCACEHPRSPELAHNLGVARIRVTSPTPEPCNDSRHAVSRPRSVPVHQHHG